METKASYIVTGAFTLAVIVGAFGFVFWFHGSGAGNQRIAYRVVFDGSVSGLHAGAAVLFNGINAGEVDKLAFDAADPRKVVAVILVGRDVPVRADTKVRLEFTGLTGLAALALTGGSAAAGLVAAADNGPPTIYADASAGADVTQAARDALLRLDGLIAANEQALRASLRNIETVTSTLAQNSERFDKVMAGVENLTGNADNPGQIGAAANSIRRLADDLDKHSDEISAGLAQFSSSGLKQFEAFAVDGRRTLSELNRAIKNIDQHPTRLLFGH